MSNCKGCGVRWNYKPEHLDYCVGCANGKLQIAIEALEFYGNKENYYTSGYGMKWFAEHGYKRSKLALEKIGVIDERID